MAHVLLSETDDWTLVHDEQDIRGRDLLDASGLRLGQIDEMVVNTETRHVDEVILTDGTRYPAADLDIEGDAVYLRGSGTPSTRQPYAYEGVRQNQPIAGTDTMGGAGIISGADTVTPATTATISGADAGDYVRPPAGRDFDSHDFDSHDFDSYDPDYEQHYGAEYGGTGNPFSAYRPAYRFGTEMSLDQGHLGTAFDDAEPRLRERWLNAFPGLRYDDYRGAVRFGFERRRG